MNLKHEMFWNVRRKNCIQAANKWTLNMKCFEIENIEELADWEEMNLKHEMFWNIENK